MMKLQKNKAYLIDITGNISEVSPTYGKEFKLKEAQEYVDGYVEIVTIDNDTIMIINEDGKYTQQPNEAATKIAHEHCSIMPYDFICGNALICPSEMFP